MCGMGVGKFVWWICVFFKFWYLGGGEFVFGELDLFGYFGDFYWYWLFVFGNLLVYWWVNG